MYPFFFDTCTCDCSTHLYFVSAYLMVVVEMEDGILFLLDWIIWIVIDVHLQCVLCFYSLLLLKTKIIQLDRTRTVVQLFWSFGLFLHILWCYSSVLQKRNPIFWLLRSQVPSIRSPLGLRGWKNEHMHVYIHSSIFPYIHIWYMCGSL